MRLIFRYGVLVPCAPLCSMSMNFHHLMARQQRRRADRQCGGALRIVETSVAPQKRLIHRHRRRATSK